MKGGLCVYTVVPGKRWFRAPRAATPLFLRPPHHSSKLLASISSLSWKSRATILMTIDLRMRLGMGCSIESELYSTRLSGKSHKRKKGESSILANKTNRPLLRSTRVDFSTISMVCISEPHCGSLSFTCV